MDTRLISSYLVGGRDAEYANPFIADLKDRATSRIQLTSDRHRAYLDALEDASRSDVDYTQLVKLYGEATAASKRRYSPSGYVGALKVPMQGGPYRKHISTSFAERQNTTMRLQLRRFMPLTSAFNELRELRQVGRNLHSSAQLRANSQVAEVDAHDGGGGQ